MAHYFLGHLLIVFLYTTVVNATTSLSSQLTKFIPECAQQCFQSFLDSNFSQSACGKSPSLECLCSTTTPGGYTVGEGALECILAEDSAGFCTGHDAQESVAVAAFAMCNGQRSAVPNTHGTLTATITVETSSSVTVTSETMLSSSTQMSFGSTSTIPTLSSVTTPASTVETSSSAQTSMTTPSATEIPSVGTALTKGQVAGITAGAVGGAAVAFGIIFLLAYLRRRSRLRPYSDTLPFQEDPATLQGHGGMQGGPGGWGDTVTPPRVPPRLDTSTPNMFSRRSVALDIGLAVSPERPDPVIQRASKLLPEKPNLTLGLPGQAALAPGERFFSQEIPTSRSSATQFEDVDGFAATEVSTGIATNLNGFNKNIPSTIDAFPIPPRNSGSQPTAQDPINERIHASGPGPYTGPLDLDRQGVGSFSRPRPRLQIPFQPGGLNVPNNLRPVTQSSSVYSQQTPHSAYTFHNAPSTSRASSSSRLGYARNLASNKQVGPYDRASENSFTSFDSEESSLVSGNLIVPATPLGTRKSVIELSPVEGSPTSGKSPVLYPKIPAPARLTVLEMKTVPPPPQPDFRSAFSSRSDVNTNLEINARRTAEVSAQHQRNMGRDDFRLSRVARASPQIPRPGLLPAAQLKERPSLQSSQGYSINYNAPQAQHSHLGSLLTLPSQRQGVSDLFHPQIHLYEPHQPQNSTQRPSPPRHIRSDSTASVNTTSSPLAAKRLGSDKAANLHLSPPAMAWGAADNQWQVVGSGSVEAAEAGGHGGCLIDSIADPDVGRQGGGGLLSSKSVRFDVDAEKRDSRPPITPGWVPRLTPTRRGDELFLRVQ